MTQVLQRTYPDIGERIELTAPITVSKADGLEYGQAEFIVSNSATDRYGESVTMEGIDTQRYMQNPVVLWGHDYNALPLGRTLSLRREAGNLVAKVQFDTDIHEFADTVYKQILRGTISAASIGGLVKSYGLTKDGKTDHDVIAEMEMVEWSVVPIPANPEALVLSKAFGMEEKVLQKQYIDFVAQAMINTEGMDTDDISHHIQTLKTLTSALEGVIDGSRVTDEATENQRKRVYRLTTARTIARTADQTIEQIVTAISSELKGKK